MAATIETIGVMNITYGGQTFTRQVQIMGIEPEERARTGGFADYIVDEKKKKITPSFEVSQALKNRAPAKRMKEADDDDVFKDMLDKEAALQVPDQGTIIGWSLGSVHRPELKEDFFIAPIGSRVILSFLSSGDQPKPEMDAFTVVAFSKTDMSEYDSTHVYVPLKRLQFLRGMGDGEGQGAVNQIQVKVKNGEDLDKVAIAINNVLSHKWPLRFRVADLGAEAGPVAGGGGRRAVDPEHPAVLHHRGRGLRNPGDFLDDRRGEDPRYRGHEGARGVDLGRAWHLPRLRAFARAGGQRGRDARRPPVRRQDQRHREVAERA